VSSHWQRVLIFSAVKSCKRKPHSITHRPFVTLSFHTITGAEDGSVSWGSRVSFNTREKALALASWDGRLEGTNLKTFAREDIIIIIIIALGNDQQDFVFVLE